MNFSCSFDSTSSRGRSKAQMSVGKVLDTISTASAVAIAAVATQNSQSNLNQDEGLEEETLGQINMERKGLLNIDLNVAPPDDDDIESSDKENGGNEQEIRPAEKVASGVSNKLGSVNEQGLSFNGNYLNQNGVQTHWSKGENNGMYDVEDEAKQMKTRNNIIADSEVEIEEKDTRSRGWSTLLEVAENALREHEENLRNKEVRIQNRTPRTSQVVELGGMQHKETSTPKKITGPQRQSFPAEWNNETDVAGAAAVVVRSTRGRVVAMPNKYKDSVLEAVAMASTETELPRHNKSGKSATIVSTKRKSR